MKLNYFYDGQFRRVLKHLIRIFGEFQVSTGYDDSGVQTYRTVPCRYADINRMSAYVISGNSENIIQSAPLITISIDSLKLDRSQTQSPISYTNVMGTNKSTATNEYSTELDQIYKVTKFNPAVWKLTFSLNIWTTTLTNKMELFEQISSLFNPSVDLQMSENPHDWSSISTVELVDCNFSSRSVPQGTDTDLDVMTLSFETSFYLSLPATVEKANLINQIVTNVTTANDEMDIALDNYRDIIVQAFTPKNLCISVTEGTSGTCVVKLLNSNLGEKSAKGSIYSWANYLNYLYPDYEDTQVGIKLQTGITDEYPVKLVMSEISEDNPNIMTVSVDTSSLTVSLAVKKMVTSSTDISNPTPTDVYINYSTNTIEYGEYSIPAYSIFKIVNDVVEIQDTSVPAYVYCSYDSKYYRLVDGVWQYYMEQYYKPGYWRLTFKE